MGFVSPTLKEKDAPIKHAISLTHATTASRCIQQNSAEPPAKGETQSTRTGRVPTPVNPDRLTRALQGYNPLLTRYLIEGFTFGFAIDFQGPPLNNRCVNLVSAQEHPEVVDCKLAKELASERITGPFLHPPFTPAFNVSPIGLQPKKTPGEFRLIHHLSHPQKGSVNFFIPQELSSVHYASISDAIASIQTCGRGCFLAKSDIKSAFRIIPIHPSAYPLLGLRWRGKFYYDRCLPMGAASSCAIFEKFSSALEWVVKQNITNCLVHHVLDDFLFISESRLECLQGLKTFQSLCAQLGVPLAPEKTEGPAQVLTFLGIELDTVEMEARLPLEKLSKCHDLITSALSSKSLKVRNIQSIIGTLNFACSVVAPGRAFLRRLIQLIIGKKPGHYHISMSSGAKADLRTWQAFLQSYNGKSIFREQRWVSSRALNLYTDAASSLGYSAILDNAWFFGEWPPSWKAYNIAILEMYPIVVAVETWAGAMANKCIVFYSDNAAVVAIINSLTSKDKQIMVLVRRLVLTCLRFNILFQAKHVQGVNNTLADLISRLKVEKFRAVAESKGHIIDQHPTKVLPPPKELT